MKIRKYTTFTLNTSVWVNYITVLHAVVSKKKKLQKWKMGLVSLERIYSC